MSSATANGIPVEVHNPSGALRVLVTKHLPGDRWLKVLTSSGCRVEVCTDPDTILSNDKVKKLIGDKCDGVIGQLTEVGAAPALPLLFRSRVYYTCYLVDSWCLVQPKTPHR
jgi:hypothetical protein